jgi:hypothetical protein
MHYLFPLTILVINPLLCVPLGANPNVYFYEKQAWCDFIDNVSFVD